MISGIVIVVALLLGVAATVIGMMLAFRELGAAESVDSSQLAHRISYSLLYGAVAIPTAIIALGLWLWATIQLRRTGDMQPKRKHRSK